MQVVSCDHCRSVFVWKTDRITLSVEQPASCPPLRGPLHFCSLECLAGWSRDALPEAIEDLAQRLAAERSLESVGVVPARKFALV